MGEARDPRSRIQYPGSVENLFRIKDPDLEAKTAPDLDPDPQQGFHFQYTCVMAITRG